MNRLELKEHERKTWAAVAEGWRRRDKLLRKGSAPVTERMLDMAGIDAGHWMLDIASGTGEPAISAAQRIGDSGRVIGTDLVEEMLFVARDKVLEENLTNIEFRCIDGEELEFEPASFDAVTIRWGLMFMPEPETCLNHAYRLLKRNGRIVIACWAAPEHNPFVSILMETLSKYTDIPDPGLDAPGMFAFADPNRLCGVLEATGFTDLAIEYMAINIIEVDDGAAYWAAMQDIARPVMALANQLNAETRAAFVEEIIEIANGFRVGDTLYMRGTTWIVSGTR
ncbi:MAG: class I SAM-dependent methyltransferase, partial [Acidiferrobacterales bacterium]